MASIITATTTSGLTQSADNSGVLQLASGTGNLVTVPSVTGTAMVSGNMPAFSAYLNSAQTLSSNTFTKITLNAEEYDTANAFDSTTNYRFTPQVAGYYQFNMQISIATTTCNIIPTLYKNGTAYIRSSNLQTTSESVSGSWMVYLNGSTDYVELWASISTGQGLSTGISNSSRTNLQGFLVRTA